MGCATIDIMMLRATVTDTDPKDPTRVWVTIPQKYGQKPVRVFTRVEVTKGDHVYVTNTSVTRVPQWVVFDQQTEVGTWGNPYPHTHPIGQVDGLVDWVKEYEAWAKDHAARLDAADKQIADGKLVVAQARKDLDQAQTDIADAVRKATLEQARLDQAEANLDQMGRNLTAAGGRISANETALANSQKRLDAAETTVQKTSKDLTALQGTVGDVQSAVVESDRKAAAAQTAADQASSAAGSAASKATAAQTTADQAKAAAGTADEAARAASGLAATKGEVIYQATAPTGARAVAQNLWIRTTDNRPHTWNGSAWVAVTDKAATDAATAAATAQSAASTAQATADQAKADAAAAAQSASAAMTKAGQAQASADGKTTITRATSPASQPGTAVGDTHFTMSTMGGGGQVLRQQRWDGSTWQDEALSHQVIASLDLGKATVGELDGGRIKAGSILSDRVVVSQGENLIPDPTFLNAAMTEARTAGTGWKLLSRADGVRVLTTNSTTQADVALTGAPGGWFQVDQAATYQLQMTASGPDQLTVFLRVLFADGSEKADGFQFVRGLTGTPTIRAVEWDMKALGAPVAVRPYLRRTPTPSGASNYWQQIAAVSFRRKVGTVLIEDGAVTGDKIEASTVSGALGQFLQVEAQSGTFTDSLTGRNARLLGETVAESINITGTLRGRDAILSGTVDVGQLNVTGEMSAKIISTATLQARQGFFTDGLTAQDATLLGTTVAEKLVVTDAFSARVVNAMTAQTKQLVVTEDAILNRATIVQSLVTPELISQKADIGDLAARMVTSGKLQTSTAANRGVKIDNAGIRAWDDTGRQTVNLNGKNNVLTGTFQTAETRQRVRIAAGGTVAAADFYAGNDTDDHLGIWYNQTGTNIANAEANVLAMLGTSHTADSPGLKMWPGRGAFTLQGRWWPDSTAMKFALFMLSAGLGAGYYQRVTLNYPTAFPTNNSIRFPFISVETRNGADVIANIVSQTESGVEVNLINKSTDKATGVLYVRVMALNMAS